MADARKIASVVSLLFLAAIVVPVAREQPATATSVREADAPCARCHQRLYDGYMKTVMANASGPAVERVTPATFRHKSSAVEYRVSVENGKVWLDFDRPGEFEIGGLHGRRLLEYYIGSGNRGRTYLYSNDNYWFEVPINWYTAFGGYDMRPGFQNTASWPRSICLWRPDVCTVIPAMFSWKYQGRGTVMAHFRSCTPASLVKPAMAILLGT